MRELDDAVSALVTLGKRAEVLRKEGEQVSTSSLITELVKVAEQLSVLPPTDMEKALHLLKGAGVYTHVMLVARGVDLTAMYIEADLRSAAGEGI